MRYGQQTQWQEETKVADAAEELVDQGGLGGPVAVHTPGAADVPRDGTRLHHLRPVSHHQQRQLLEHQFPRVEQRDHVLPLAHEDVLPLRAGGPQREAQRLAQAAAVEVVQLAAAQADQRPADSARGGVGSHFACWRGCRSGERAERAGHSTGAEGGAGEQAADVAERLHLSFGHLPTRARQA